MTKAPTVLTRKEIEVHCPSCGHWKANHGKGTGCSICRNLHPWKICNEFFPSRLSRSEIDQARAADKDSFPSQTVCAVCFEIWMAHTGYLCPNGQTLFVPLLTAGDLV